MARPSNIEISDKLKQEVIAFYLLPSSAREIERKFGINWYQLKKILVENNISLHDAETTQKLKLAKLQETLFAEYGVLNTFDAPEIKEKCKKTNLMRYGCEYAMQNRDLQKKSKETCIKNHGGRTDVGQFGSIEHKKWNENGAWKEKSKKTCRERYGTDYYTQTDWYLEKSRKTCTERYGVDNYAKTGEYLEKSKRTCTEKYGVDNYTKTDWYIEESKKTCIEKYDAENFTQSETYHKNLPGYLQKSYLTKKKNGTFNISKPEENYYLYLVETYGKDNVIRQYREERYPFNCDFYIKSEDLFIELNLNWTHGGKLFEGTEEDLKKLEIWKEKAEKSKFYKNAIETWTIRDTKKYEIAQKNKLNYNIIYWSDWKKIEKEIGYGTN